MASRGQVSALSASASAAVAHAKTLSTSAAAVMESLFQKSLQDLVKGLRAQTIGEALYLAQALKDIRKEMKSKDDLTKAMAVQKLTYIHMLQSSDMSWAAFPVIEMMSSPKFGYKQIGYLAACQSFNDDTDVLLLTTNLVRKDLSSANQVEAALALNYIASVANAELAADLMPDVFTMLSSGRPLVRKRATLALMRLVDKFPDTLNVAFQRLVERLDDNETGVVAAAVNVLCQLAAHDPPQFLPLAPDFFRLLTSSTSTWIRIKVVKLFGLLAPHEPRLAKKITEPLCEILRSTPAKSLQFEIIKTVTGGMPQQTTAVTYCILRLGEFIGEGDPNLCYLSLQALSSLLPAHSAAVADLQGPVIACLGNADPGIRHLALRILTGVVTRSTLIPTVRVLEHLLGGAGDEFRDGLVRAMLGMGGGGLYEKVEDFEWYAEIVFDCATVPGMGEGAEVARQIVDLAVRVGEMRPKLVLHAQRLVLHSTRLGSTDSESHRTVALALGASAWVLGEFFPSEREGTRPAALNPRDVIGGLVQVAVQALPPAVQAIYLQAVMKVLLTAVSDSLEDVGGREEGASKEGEVVGMEDGGGPALTFDASEESVTMDASTSPEEVGKGAGLETGGRREEGVVEDGVGGEARVVLDLVRENVSGLTRSCHMAVQEGACELMAVADVFSSLPKQTLRRVVRRLKTIFGEELPPIAVGAQKRVPVPAGLVLPQNYDDFEAAIDAVLPPDSPGVGRQLEVGAGGGAAGGPSGWAPSIDGGEAGGAAYTSLEEHRVKYSPFYLPMNEEAPSEGFGTDVVDEVGVLDQINLFADSRWKGRKADGGSRMEVRREEEDLPPLPEESGNGVREGGVREGGVVPLERYRRKKEAGSEGTSGGKKAHRRKEGRGDGAGQKDGGGRKSKSDVKKVTVVREDVTLGALVL